MQKTALRIRLFGDPVLRRKSRSVKQVSETHRQILSQMAQLMYADSGIGLACPQVGINEQMIVADIGGGLYKLINPRVVRRSGAQAREEGCLSIPGICIKVKRAKKVLIEAQDEFAKPVRIEAEGLLACVFQHEIDHLKGRLIVDYASFWKKLQIRKELEVIKERSKDERLSEPQTKSCRLQL
jgi:peptide deformylase